MFANGAVTAAFARAFGEAASGGFRAPGGGGVTRVTAEARKAFRSLASGLEGTPHDSEMAAALAFADVFVPYTEQYGLEVGANIEAGDFRIADITLGGRGSVATPSNVLAIADVHTHPAGSGPGLSGTLRFVGGRLQTSSYGDYGTNWSRRTNGYVFQAGGARSAWMFDYGAFEASVRSSRVTGADTYAEWFTKPIR